MLQTTCQLSASPGRGTEQKHNNSNTTETTQLSRDKRFPSMLYVRPAKAQTSLRIRAV